MQIDKERIEKYLDQIVTEIMDLEMVLARSNDEVLADRLLLKGLKYSTIVIAEAIASILQHILAKGHNVVVDGYMDVFRKTKENHLLPDDLLVHLQPFISFRNMLVHQYSRVDDHVFLKNLRKGLQDFKTFIKEIRGWVCD